MCIKIKTKLPSFHITLYHCYSKWISNECPYPWIMNLGVLLVHCLSQTPQCWSRVGFPNSAGLFFLRFFFRFIDLFVLLELFFFFFRLRFRRFFPQNPISPLFAPRTHVPHLRKSSNVSWTDFCKFRAKINLITCFPIE